jgi:arylsulfatase A-like enzyme
MGLPMGLERKNATERIGMAMACEASPGPDTGPVTTVTILLLAVWIGLIAGFLDLVLMMMNRRLIEGGFYRLGGDFGWLIPAGVTILVLVPAVVLVLFARLRGRSVRLGLAVGLLSFVGFLDVSARLPLELWGVLLLSGGLAKQLARLVSRRPLAFVQLVRRTVPLLAVVLLTIMMGTVGGRAWAEHRATAALPPPHPAARNVVLAVWDTVRAGNTSLNGYNRPTTPNLELLAGRGVRFDLAFSTSSWTLPAHASLFTGRWPHELGVDWNSPMRDDVPTLAEYLANHGYDTAGFVANLDYCNRETGLARGFAHYEDFPIELYDVFTRYTAFGSRTDVLDAACVMGALIKKVTGRRYDMVPRSKEHVKNAAAVDQAFLGWLSRRAGRSRPFFAFLNYNDAHTPYEVPDSSIPGFGLRPASSWDHLTLYRWNTLKKATFSNHDVGMAADIYDDCIAYLDRRLEILLQELKRRGVLDDTLVIVAADHGEHLGDHLLFFHGCSLYRQLVQVPLVIVDPQKVPAGRIVSKPVSLRDVPATIVDLLDVGSDTPFPGKSLARFWDPAQGADGPPAEPLLMETGKPILLTNEGREPAAKGPMKSIVADGMHYIRSGDGLEELYVLGTDPDERTNIAGSPMVRAVIQRCRDRLAAMLVKH